MDQMRLTLAVLAALIALVFVGVWFAKGRQHSTKGRGATLFYAILLFASAGFLFVGAQNKQARLAEETIETPAVTRVETKESKQTETKTPVKEPVPIESKPEEVFEDVNQKRETPSSSADVATVTSVVRKPKPASSRDLPTVSRPKPKDLPVEDVIESSVLNAFDVIELFFETYGSPNPVSRSTANGHLANGSIEFRSGSAELSPQSLRYLRALAAQLGMTYQDGQLEIRAQSSEKVDSPVHRFLLTQSRAEAVRDVLAAEGFPLSRLVPIGSETEGETRVKFVHRPN